MRLIDADKLITEIKREYCEECIDDICDLCWVTEYIELLTKAPTVEAEPIRHGHWKITDQDVMGKKTLMCSYCTSVTKGFTFPNYCFNCGAKMDEEVE